MIIDAQIKVKFSWTQVSLVLLRDGGCPRLGALPAPPMPGAQPVECGDGLEVMCAIGNEVYVAVPVVLLDKRPSESPHCCKGGTEDAEAELPADVGGSITIRVSSFLGKE